MSEALLELEQNTEAWLRWRQGGIGSSDAPIIMGVSPWCTPYQLWLQKTGQLVTDQASNWAIERGNKWEPKVRARYELEHDCEMVPEACEHPEYPFLRASLDGRDKAARRLLEIKCPGEEVFQKAKDGVVDDKYWPQVQHQLLVTEDDELHFYCAKIEKPEGGSEKLVDTALVVVKPDWDYIKNTLLPAELEFWEMVQKRRPPRLSKGDTLQLLDDDSREYFTALKAAKLKADEACKAYEDIKAQLEARMVHTKMECEGVVVSKNKRGSIIVKIKGEQ